MADTNTNNSAPTSVSDLKTASDLVNKFNEIKQARETRERDWRLNLAFYRGNQYTFYNRISRRIESLPVEDADKPRWRVRIVANRITRGSQTLLSILTKTKPVMYATPESGDNNALKAAQVAERLLEMWWGDLNLRDKLQEAVLWSIIVGQGYWKITWDNQANKPMTFTMDPQGNPITDESLKQLYEGELEQMGVDPQMFQKTVYMGDICVEALSPFDVFPDPSARTFGECKWVICRHAMTLDQIKGKFGIDIKGMQTDAVSASPDQSVSFMASEREKKYTDLKYVYYGYFLPTPVLPKGRYVVWMDGKPQILVDDPWEKHFPFSKLPIVKFPGIRVPGDVYDDAVVTMARPLQKEFNRTLSQIIEHKNLTVKPQWTAPAGSLRTRLTSEPGAVFEYAAAFGNLRPEPMPIQAIPPYVLEHLNNIKQRMDEMFGLTDITQGKPPPNVEAGIAIDLLQEIATDAQAPTIGMLEEALADAGQLMLTLAQQFYVEPRLLKIKGSGSRSQVKQFTKADIAGGITISAEAGSGLPRTRAGRQAQIMAWVKEGIIPPDRAWKYFETADMKAVGQMFMSDEDMAYREQDRLLEGGVINQLAMNQMQQQIQQMGGINPQTGVPFQSMDEIQNLLETAAYGPTDYESYREHLDVHSLFMKSVEFEVLPPEVQQKFIMHYQLTLQKLQSMPVQPKEVDSPRVGLTLHGTVGATGAAEILKATGVSNITPEIMQEPPLETVVFDNMDKPNDPNAVAGNDPYAMAQLDSWKQEQEMIHAQQKHAMDMQQQQEAHDMKMKQAKSNGTKK